jgi:hypothetical protein
LDTPKEYAEQLLRLVALKDAIAWLAKEVPHSEHLMKEVRVSRDREHGFHRIMSNDFRGS